MGDLFGGWESPVALGDIEDSSALPEGEYTFTINDVKIGDDKEGNPRLMIFYKSPTGQTAMDSITQKSLWKFKQICVAAGFSKDAKVFYPSLKGKRIKATVSIWKGNDRSYNNFKYHA